MIVKGGINRLKQHIANIKDDVRSYPSSTDEKKTLSMLNLEATKMRRSEEKKS